MRAAILLIIATLFGIAHVWNIPKDTNPSRNQNAQESLLDSTLPAANEHSSGSFGSESGLHEAVDTSGDISVLEKWPSPMEPEFSHPSMDSPKVPITSSDAMQLSGLALAGHQTAIEPALVDPHQDHILNERKDNYRRFSAGTEEEEEREEAKWDMEKEVKSREPRAHRGKIQLFEHPRDIPEEGYGNA